MTNRSLLDQAKVPAHRYRMPCGIFVGRSLASIAKTKRGYDYLRFIRREFDRETPMSEQIFGKADEYLAYHERKGLPVPTL